MAYEKGKSEGGFKKKRPGSQKKKSLRILWKRK